MPKFILKLQRRLHSSILLCFLRLSISKYEIMDGINIKNIISLKQLYIGTHVKLQLHFFSQIIMFCIPTVVISESTLVCYFFC